MNAINPEFERNLGFMSESEQQRLIDSRVAIAGAGGDGGMLALQLARLGVGNIILADPDPFEAENTNRQAVCTTETVGVNKAVAVGDYINKINPDIKVEVYTDGIHEDNVEEFVRGADLVIDETEFSMHELGTMLARESRKQGIPNLMALNLGFGAHVTSYLPDGVTFEKMLGLSETAPLDEIRETEVSVSRWLAALPKYANLETFMNVAEGKNSVPTVAPGVALAAGAASVQATLHLWQGKNRRPAPVSAKQTLVIDAYTGEARRIKHPRLNIAKDMARMALRSKLGLNPETAY